MNINRHTLLRSFALLSAITLVAPIAVQADDKLALEEVIVTAQKREQGAQEVPLVVAAVTAEKLEAVGIRSLENLPHAIPGLVINNANSLLLPFIRGVGAFNAGAASPSSVAIYIDGLYTPRSNALAFSLDNVQQIEVLKGPQSTLYGRNATGGAITITTAIPQPGDELSGKVKATIGNYNQRRFSGHIAGALGSDSQWAGSLTAAIVKRDGYIDNLATTANPAGLRSTTDDVNSEDERTIAAKLAFHPTDNSQFTLSASYREFDDTSNFSYKQFNSVFASLFGARITDDHETYAHWGYRDGDDTAINLTARIDFNGMYLISISGYLNNYLSANTEAYALPLDFAGFQVDWETTSYSQEFRLHSNTNNALQWMVGTQYFQEGDDSSEIWGTIGTVASLGGDGMPGTRDDVPLGLSPTPGHPLGDTDWQSTSYAVFGEVVYAVTENLNITFGLRNTWEEFELSDNRNGTFFGAIGFRGVPVASASEKWDEITYRLVLDYSFNRGMVYASRSKGFVSGLLNVQNPAGDVIEPEILVAHEIGIKSDLLDGRVRLNGAVFDYEYEDIHAQTVNAQTGLTNLVSGQEASIRGAELDLSAALTSNLTLTSGVTRLFDREYGLFDVPAGAGGFPAVVATGNTIAGAPETSLTVALTHDLSFNQGRINSNLSASYNSGVFFDVEESVGSGGLDDASYTLVNFQTTYYTGNEHWSISVWANNITDEYYVSGGIKSGPSIVGIEGAPRMYGVSAGYSF